MGATRTTPPASSAAGAAATGVRTARPPRRSATRPKRPLVDRYNPTRRLRHRLRPADPGQRRTKADQQKAGVSAAANASTASRRGRQDRPLDTLHLSTFAHLAPAGRRRSGPRQGRRAPCGLRRARDLARRRADQSWRRPTPQRRPVRRQRHPQRQGLRHPCFPPRSAAGRRRPPARNWPRATSNTTSRPVHENRHYELAANPARDPVRAVGDGFPSRLTATADPGSRPGSVPVNLGGAFDSWANESVTLA